MDWIKKNSDKFALAVLALLLLVFSALIILRTTSFGETFASIQTAPPRNDQIPAVDTTVIQAAQQQLDKPVLWQPDHEKHGPLFVSRPYLIGPDGQPERTDKGGMLRPPVPNQWLTEFGLNILSSTVLEEDPDKDGFSTLDEFLGADRSPANGIADATDPTKADSRPPYHTKLFVKQYIRVPFRLLFNAFDGDPKQPDKMEFQINTLDLRQPTMFLKIGEQVTNTKFKLEKFEPKFIRNESTGEDSDVSELTIINSETQERVVLVLTKVTDSPDSYALFEYRWPQPPLNFQVKKNQEFVLKPLITERYKLIDIKETEALIQLPNGEKYTVPRLP